MKCVKDAFSERPACLRPLLKRVRAASRVATAISRNVVAVGTERLSVIFCTSRAAGPFRGAEGLWGGGAVVAGTAGVVGVATEFAAISLPFPPFPDPTLGMTPTRPP